jgi:hypothetical protein
MHADKCIGKVTNFITTISCFPGPHQPFYTVELEELRLVGKSYKRTRHCVRDLTAKESLCIFNGEAAAKGFKTRLKIEDFQRKAKS